MSHFASPAGASARPLTAPLAVGMVRALAWAEAPFWTMYAQRGAARAWVPDSAGEFSRRSMVVTFSPAFCARGSTSPRPPRSGGPHRRSLAMWVPIVQQRCVASTIAVSIVFRNSSERSDAPMEFSSVGAASWVDSLAVHSVWYALLSDARCTLPMACASLAGVYVPGPASCRWLVGGVPGTRTCHGGQVCFATRDPSHLPNMPALSARRRTRHDGRYTRASLSTRAVARLRAGQLGA
eukprot:CAMPEP_0179844408 /NCGR_PEP_ID=MMETSP0982-20121206/4321_1 /TAXON_ID=483367 /ORGANISM="non described non described, Strain CCMP 2436" /LENGTH=237 /DNA_ID=CAMNT_0021729099 /DNA_START=392 /DNA_END=1107 /DNA_ORIENTATION=-